MRTLTRRTTSAAHSVRPATTAAAVVAATLLLVAAPALAHPFVTGGGQVPVQSLATITLDLAHGCGVEAAGTGPDTDEVALEVPVWLRIVDVPEPDGWALRIEEASGATLGAVIWSATTGAEPAPRFALDVVVDGQPGETRLLRVSQRCGDLVERWVGTPEQPAEQPAVRLKLVEPDPSSPPPSEPALAQRTSPAPPSTRDITPAPADTAPDASPVGDEHHAAASAGSRLPGSAPARTIAVVAAATGAAIGAHALRQHRRRIRGRTAVSAPY